MAWAHKSADFNCFYDVLIRFWNYSDSVVFFVFLFISKFDCLS